MSLKVFVGSLNPVKINAAKEALSDLGSKFEVVGIDVKSGVRDQPVSDDETKQGAIHRAQQALKQGQSQLDKQMLTSQLLGIGVEGGVVDDGEEMWTTVWAAVASSDVDDHIFTAAGGRFLVPDFIAQAIRDGQEMGLFVAKFFAGRQVKEQEGLVGLVTNKYVDRTQLYSNIIKLAIGLWLGQDWQSQLDIQA